MKLCRTLSGILFGVGCAMAFVGLLSLLLPVVANDQLQLVLASFSLPATNLLVGMVNTCMSFALANGWQVLLTGAVMLSIGVTLFSRFTPVEEPLQSCDRYRRPAAVSAEPLWEQSEPAHTGPNPFAKAALWEQYAPEIQPMPARETPKAGFGSLLLEPNRVEEVEKAAPVQAYVRPVAPPQPPNEPEPEIVPEPSTAEELPLSEKTNVPQEPEQAGNQPQSGKPVQISPRIRSTMGKRREW